MDVRRISIQLISALAALCLIPAACGGGSEGRSKELETVVNRYLLAWRDGDAAAFLTFYTSGGTFGSLKADDPTVLAQVATNRRTELVTVGRYRFEGDTVTVVTMRQDGFALNTIEFTSVAPPRIVRHNFRPCDPGTADVPVAGRTTDSPRSAANAIPCNIIIGD